MAWWLPKVRGRRAGYWDVVGLAYAKAREGPVHQYPPVRVYGAVQAVGWRRNRRVVNWRAIGAHTCYGWRPRLVAEWTLLWLGWGGYAVPYPVWARLLAWWRGYRCKTDEWRDVVAALTARVADIEARRARGEPRVRPWEPKRRTMRLAVALPGVAGSGEVGVRVVPGGTGWRRT